MNKSTKIPAKVLVVEDDPDILNALNVALGSAGFDVDVLLNGKGILKNQFVLPDLFIIDKQLPDVDGLDICRFLHSKPNYRTIPVIIISASQRMKKKALEAGATSFIEKPFAVKDLVNTINKALHLPGRT
jgi:DNA-binding response OmpR family regulator